MRHTIKHLKKHKITRKKNKKNKSKKRGGASYYPLSEMNQYEPALAEPVPKGNQLTDYFYSILDLLRDNGKPGIIDTLRTSDHIYLTSYHVNMHGSDIPEEIPQRILNRYFPSPVSNVYARGCLFGGVATAGGWNQDPLFTETIGTVKYMSENRQPLENIHNRGKPQKEFLVEKEMGYTPYGPALSGILVTPPIHIGVYNPKEKRYVIPEVSTITNSTFKQLPINFRSIKNTEYYKLSDILSLICKDIFSKDYGTRHGDTVFLPIILITHCSSSIAGAGSLDSNPSGQKGAQDSFSTHTIALIQSVMGESAASSRSSRSSSQSSSEWGGSSHSSGSAKDYYKHYYNNDRNENERNRNRNRSQNRSNSEWGGSSHSSGSVSGFNRPNNRNIGRRF